MFAACTQNTRLHNGFNAITIKIITKLKKLKNFTLFSHF